MQPSLLDRYTGCILGLACGDAVGTTVEFRPRNSFPPVTDMIGGGPFGLRPGQWTDDTSMALCLAESLLTKANFDPHDQMTRYLNWWTWGYLSSTGICFDIGITVREALTRFHESGEPFSGSTDVFTAGNGSLMRLAPIVLFFFPNESEVIHFSADSSRTTHAAPEAVECCILLSLILYRCLKGQTKKEVLQVSTFSFQEPKVKALATGSYISKSINEIKGIGYSVASLEAALWCFATTSTMETAVLAAANLGDDADTTAAIVGQIAGAYYGIDSIPSRWLERLYMGNEIRSMAEGLYEIACNRQNHQE